MQTQLLPCGANVVEAFHHRFYSIDTDALVSQDCVTFQDIDGLFYDVKSAGEAAAAAPAPASKGLLGDMPNIGGKTSSQQQAPKQQIAAPVEIQQNFVAPKKQYTPPANLAHLACALNGHTMKNPVTSPYGHNFEKDTIESWIKQQGSVCPLTGKPLYIEQLQPNKALQQEVMKLVVQESMSAFNQEDEADLYDF